jgi:hypothetical protein
MTVAGKEPLCGLGRGPQAGSCCLPLVPNSSSRQASDCWVTSKSRYVKCSEYKWVLCVLPAVVSSAQCMLPVGMLVGTAGSWQRRWMLPAAAGADA